MSASIDSTMHMWREKTQFIFLRKYQIISTSISLFNLPLPHRPFIQLYPSLVRLLVVVVPFILITLRVSGVCILKFQRVGKSTRSSPTYEINSMSLLMNWMNALLSTHNVSSTECGSSLWHSRKMCGGEWQRGRRRSARRNKNKYILQKLLPHCLRNGNKKYTEKQEGKQQQNVNRFNVCSIRRRRRRQRRRR